MRLSTRMWRASLWSAIHCSCSGLRDFAVKDGSIAIALREKAPLISGKEDIAPCET